MENEEDILWKLSNGDSDAFRVVFMKYAPRVEAFALKLLKNSHEAQDVSQNIFTKLWLQRASLKNVQSLNAYLFRMTRNAVLDIFKHNRIRAAYETGSAQNAPTACNDLTERVDTNELAALVEGVLQKMPPRRCQVYRLSREEGKNNEQIAEELQISPKSVENHLTKALYSIKKEIS